MVHQKPSLDKGQVELVYIFALGNVHEASAMLPQEDGLLGTDNSNSDVITLLSFCVDEIQ